VRVPVAGGAKFAGPRPVELPGGDGHGVTLLHRGQTNPDLSTAARRTRTCGPRPAGSSADRDDPPAPARGRRLPAARPQRPGFPRCEPPQPPRASVGGAGGSGQDLRMTKRTACRGAQRGSPAACTCSRPKSLSRL
jgi:hypothetical protein